MLKSEEATFRSTIQAHLLPTWKHAVAKLAAAFDYVEDRLTDNCDAPYHMKEQHESMRLFQARARLIPTMCAVDSVRVLLTICFALVCYVRYLTPSLAKRRRKTL